MSTRPRVIGNGSIYQVKEGVFQYRFNLGKDPKTGKYAYSPKRTLHCEGMNKRTQNAMLRKALEEYKEELNSGIVRDSGNRTVAEYAEDFHSLREDSFRSPLAYAREGNYISHIHEMFAHIRLADLHPDDIRHIYADARKRECQKPSCTERTSSSDRFSRMLWTTSSFFATRAFRLNFPNPPIGKEIRLQQKRHRASCPASWPNRCQRRQRAPCFYSNVASDEAKCSA